VVENEEESGGGDEVEYVGRKIGVFSEGWVMTWVGDLEWTQLTADIVKKVMVIQATEIWHPVPRRLRMYSNQKPWRFCRSQFYKCV